MCLFSVALRVASAAELGPSSVTNAVPHVVSVSEPIRLGRPLTIHVDGFRPWVDRGNVPHKLLLYLGGRPSMGDYPEAVNVDKGDLVYHLTITPENRDLWEDILRQPKHLSRKIAVSIGPDADSHFVAVQPGQNVVSLQIVPSPWGLVSLAVLGLTLAGLVYLARHTDLIRDAGPPSTPERPKPYSLARTQMAVWFYLVFAAYLAIWLVTGDLNTITEALLGLMGISAGTALAGAVIDNQKPEMDAGVSEGFLRDILRDGQGFSLHRFQIAAWTVALGVIFVADAYSNLRMPEFSATLLGLMGISAGTYLGFKVPEH